MTDPAVVVTHSEEETAEVGRALAGALTAGSVVLLFGPLGAGKTAFVRGLAAGLDIDPEEVSSPTFTLLHQYRGRIPLYHADLYRVDPSEVEDLGLDQLARQAVLAVEWADKLPRPVGGAIQVRLDDLGGDERRIRIDYSSR